MEIQTQATQPVTETILVFKTNLNSHQDVVNIESGLNNIREITTWSVDTHDIDKVLRIETTSDNISTMIISILN
ncbi:MAG: hypothetical protein ABJH04_11855 [Cyclobacteriaceae bacterium]